MKMLFRCIAALTLFMSFYSCRSTKKIQTAITKIDTTRIPPPRTEDPNAKADSMKFISDTYTSIQKNLIDFRTFSAKIKVNFEDKDGKKNDFTAFIRLRKDSTLWISINAIFGVEAFRVLITPDSIKILNKLDKKYQANSVSSLQEIANVPFTFKELQNILVGNPIYLDSNIIAYIRNDKGISLISIGQVFKHLLTVNKDDYTLQNSKIDDIDVNRARTCQIIYGDYDKKADMSFSKFRKIIVSEKTKLDIEMDYKQYGFNEELNYPFTIPKNFKRQ